jgi:hypothetical protein
MLKEYVIDLRGYDGKLRELISTGLQKHAFRLGWIWSTGKHVHHTRENVLYFDADGEMCHNEYIDNSFNNTPISPADFLALTTEDVQDEPDNPKLRRVSLIKLVPKIDSVTDASGLDQLRGLAEATYQLLDAIDVIRRDQKGNEFGRMAQNIFDDIRREHFEEF